MPVHHTPDGYHSVQPYLMFQDTRAAIEFYTEAFGASEVLCMKNAHGAIQHAEMRIGDSIVMMADEAPAIEAYSITHYGGSPVSFLIYTADCDAVYRKALRAGGISVREPADQPYGDRMSGIRDPFGYRWFIATHIRDLSPAELQAL